MNEIGNYLGLEATIHDYQATYVILSFAGSKLRVDISGKKEFLLKKGTGGTIVMYAEHPLLVNYNEPWQETYINSKPSDAKAFVEELRSTIQRKMGHWRNWVSYFTKQDLPFSVIQENIVSGNGILAWAPLSITKLITEVCRQQGVITWTSRGGDPIAPKKLLFVGDNYIIAESFVEHNTERRPSSG